MGAGPAQGPGHQQRRAVALALPRRTVLIISKVCLRALVPSSERENAPSAGAGPHGCPAKPVGKAELILRVQGGCVTHTQALASASTPLTFESTSAGHRGTGWALRKKWFVLCIFWGLYSLHPCISGFDSEAALGPGVGLVWAARARTSAWAPITTHHRPPTLSAGPPIRED